jgi:hypothetical protein
MNDKTEFSNRFRNPILLRISAFALGLCLAFSALADTMALGFAAQQTFATGTYPISVTVADVNGDGKPDLIDANAYDNTISVLLNTTAPWDTIFVNGFE